MTHRVKIVLLSLVFAVLTGGCQVVNTGTETRMDEQMLNVSYENARAQELFAKIIYGTDRQENTARIGAPSLSLYSRTETVAFNAHCNDHIRAADTNGDLVITENEAQTYYQRLLEQGKIKDQRK